MAKKTDKEFTEIERVIKLRNDGAYIDLDGVMYKRLPETRQKADGLEAVILNCFENTFKAYARRDAKAQAYKTYRKKFNGLKTEEEVLERARALYKVVMVRQKQFQAQNRQLQYYPMLSTLLNSEVL